MGFELTWFSIWFDRLKVDQYFFLKVLPVFFSSFFFVSSEKFDIFNELLYHTELLFRWVSVEMWGNFSPHHWCVGAKSFPSFISTSAGCLGAVDNDDNVSRWRRPISRAVTQKCIWIDILNEVLYSPPPMESTFRLVICISNLIFSYSIDFLAFRK